LTDTMRAIEVLGTDHRNIRVVELPRPEPQAGQAQVRMKAATLNYRDLMLLEGRGAVPARTPYTPLSDGCGEVTAVGEGVTRVQVGDRVCPTFFQSWITGPAEAADFSKALGGPVDGVAAEFACYPQDSLVRVPPELSDLEAAALPCAGLTAWNALFTARTARPGDIVLLQGTGGVSVAGLQFAKAAGAVVIITSSSDAKLARARAIGADHAINYRSDPDWAETARARTGGRGVDVVLEVGGAGTLAQSLSALRAGGALCAIGLLTGTPASPPADGTTAFHRIRVGNRDQFEEMLRGIEANAIRPVIDRVFPMEKLAEAMQTLAAGEMFGKIGIAL
jgi:NADPH:quinone reductase-like Zn-dependent oxidoreductase